MTDLRSRSGCLTCRRRHKKCDEARPCCRTCSRLSLECEYSSGLRWIEFGRVSRPRVSRKQSRPLPKPLSKPAVANNEAPAATFAPAPIRDLVDFHQHQQPSPESRHALLSLSPSSHLDDGESANACCVPQANDGEHPSMSYMLPAHDNDEDNEEDDDEDEREEGDEEDEEETIDSESPDLWVLDDGMFGGLLSKCFQTPGEGIAFAYYFKYLSGLIPAYDGIQNPYRKLSTVALEYPVLLNTIISLATEYMHWHGHIPAELALTRHDRALASIREALNVSFTGTASSAPVVPGNDRLTYKQATLAAVLLQITRVIFSGGNEVDMHLKCALYILQELDYIHRPTTSFIARLLMQRFAIVDVVTSILRRRRPHLPPTSWIFKPQETLDSTEPSFREMTGCPQPIFGYLARACNLAVDVAEDVNNMEVLEQAFRLERDLHAYALAQDATPTTVEGKRGSGSTADASLTTLNECYRWCVHLLIQRRVYLEPTFSRRVQQTARTLFRLMASIPVGSGPDSSLPLLLNLVAREAVREEDRAWVRERNQQMEGVYPDSTRDGFIAMCEKMWRRVDECMEVGGVMLKRTEEALELLEQEAALFMF